MEQGFFPKVVECYYTTENEDRLTTGLIRKIIENIIKPEYTGNGIWTGFGWRIRIQDSLVNDFNAEQEPHFILDVSDPKLFMDPIPLPVIPPDNQSVADESSAVLKVEYHETTVYPHFADDNDGDAVHQRAGMLTVVVTYEGKPKLPPPDRLNVSSGLLRRTAERAFPC